MYIYLNNKQQTTKHIENKWDKKRAELEKQAEIAGEEKMDVADEFEEELDYDEEVAVTGGVVEGGEPLGTAAEELARLGGLLGKE